LGGIYNENEKYYPAKGGSLYVLLCEIYNDNTKINLGINFIWSFKKQQIHKNNLIDKIKIINSNIVKGKI